MIYINLENDVNNLPQRAIFTGLHWITSVKQVVMRIEYGVYQNDSFTYQPSVQELIADNTTCVDSNGNYVPVGTKNSMGEYDFFETMISQPINLSELIQTYMTKAKNSGRFI
jgi:hypothetical protein